MPWQSLVWPLNKWATFSIESFDTDIDAPPAVENRANPPPKAGSFGFFVCCSCSGSENKLSALFIASAEIEIEEPPAVEKSDAGPDAAARESVGVWSESVKEEFVAPLLLLGSSNIWLALAIASADIEIEAPLAVENSGMAETLAALGIDSNGC